jgi:hypothetical protein
MKRCALITLVVLVNALWAGESAAADSAVNLTGVGGQREFQREFVWPRWQARVGLATTSDSELLRPAGHSGSFGGLVLGDYYFARFDRVASNGGLRATGGLLLGATLAARTSALADSTMLRSGQGLNLSLLRSPRGLPLGEFAPASLGATPYLGLGWSSESLWGAWGLSADLGVTAGWRTSAAAAASSRSLDELLRELRFAPVMNLGVSYAF